MELKPRPVVLVSWSNWNYTISSNDALIVVLKSHDRMTRARNLLPSIRDGYLTEQSRKTEYIPYLRLTSGLRKLPSSSAFARSVLGRNTP